MIAERHDVFSIAINYSQSLQEMIDAASYDEVSKDITPRNFYLTATGDRIVELTLVQFKRPMSPLDILNHMQRESYRPATIEELLALGANKPDVQRSIPIVALGSSRTYKNSRWFPCLGGSRVKRTLKLVIMYRRWSIYYRFAFVRE